MSESIERRVDPEGVRSVFLGFNDGLVEILGAVSGLFAAFEDAASILMAIHLVLEAIEIHGVRKYLTLWEAYQRDPLGAAVREVLEDEFRHEDRWRGRRRSGRRG